MDHRFVHERRIHVYELRHKWLLPTCLHQLGKGDNPDGYRIELIDRSGK